MKPQDHVKHIMVFHQLLLKVEIFIEPFEKLQLGFNGQWLKDQDLVSIRE